MKLRENNQQFFGFSVKWRNFYQNAQGAIISFQDGVPSFSRIKDLWGAKVQFLFLMTILNSLTGCSDFPAPPEKGWANKYNEAIGQRDLLIKKYKAVVNQYNEMVEEHSTVLSQYDKMKSEHDIVVSQNNEIVNEYNTIASRHSALVDKYNDTVKEIQSYAEQRSKDNALLIVNYIKSVHAMNMDLMKFSLNVRKILVSDNPKSPEDYQNLKVLFEKGEKSILHAQDELRELTGILFRGATEDSERQEFANLLDKVKYFINLKGVLLDHKSLWFIVEREFHPKTPVINGAGSQKQTPSSI